MRVVAAVLRRGFVREELVVGQVVEIHIVSRGPATDWWVHAKIANQSSHRDVHDIVTKTAAIRPAAGNNAIAESRLNLADQSVAAEDAQPRETGIIRVRALRGPVTCQPAWICGQIDLNQIGNKNSRDVSPACLHIRQLTTKDDDVNQVREFRCHRICAEQLVVRLGAGSAVAVLIGDGNQALVEKRVALPGDLHPRTKLLRAAIPRGASCFIAQYSQLTAAGCCIDANDLLVPTQFTYRNNQRHEMNVESALRVLAWRTKLQQIEYGIDVSIETIVTLTRK